ncbi:MAG: hypothetical protein QMD95_00225 [Candidatus Hodarchaeaceae archaeon]|nr:hypothetical protein [Candidatus Hodarchaeaceae archaeon]
MIRIEQQFDAGFAGDAGDNLDCPRRILSGRYTGSLRGVDIKDFYQIGAEKGKTIGIKENHECDFDLHLYDPEQNLIASSTHLGHMSEEIIYTAEMSGYYYIEVRKISGDGTYTLVVDTTPPTTPIVGEDHCGREWSNHNSPHWYWVASDPDTGVNQYEVYRSWSEDTFYTTDTSYHPTLADGIYYIKVRAQNGAGAWSDWSGATYVYIDTVPPTSSVDTISPYWQSELPFTITATATDDRSGVKEVMLFYRYSNDNMGWNDWRLYGVDNEWPWECSFDAPEEDGYYEFGTLAVDRAGNLEQPVVESRTLIGSLRGEAGASFERGPYEVEAPEYEYGGNPGNPNGTYGIWIEIEGENFYGYWENGWWPTWIDVTMMDVDIRVRMEIKEIWGRHWIPEPVDEWVEELEGFRGRIWLPEPVRIGNIEVISVDGNIRSEFAGSDTSDYIYTVWFDLFGDVNVDTHITWPKATARAGVDTTPPESYLDQITPYWQNDETLPLEVTAKASDILSGVGNVELFYRYSPDNSSWSEWRSLGIDDNEPWTWKFDSPAGDGYYEFTSVATDRAGNAEGMRGAVSVVHVDGTFSSISAPASTEGWRGLAWDGGDKVYMRTWSELWSYSISNNTWTHLTAMPAEGASFNSLIWADGHLYALRGYYFDPKHDFWRYSISANRWESMASTPIGIHRGALVWTGDDYIYTLDNGGIFLRYSISGNRWDTLSFPSSMLAADLTWDGRDHIYALLEGTYYSLELWRYTISSDSWVRLKTISGVTPVQAPGYPYPVAIVSIMIPGDGYLYLVWQDGKIWRYELPSGGLMSVASGIGTIWDAVWNGESIYTDGGWKYTPTVKAVVTGAMCGVDTMPPLSSVDPVSPLWQNAGTVPFQVTATVSDALSGAENIELWYRYSADNSTWSDWALYDIDNSEPYSWTFDAPAGDGFYEFYSVAADRAGNREAAPESADAQAGVDTLPPISSLNSIEPHWHNASMLPIEVTAAANDPVPPNGAVPSGMRDVRLYYRYSPDNLNWSGWTLYAADDQSPYAWQFDPSQGNGYYELYSIAADVAGNVEKAPEEPDERIGVDTTPPVSSVDPIEPYWQTLTPFAITATASDGLSGVASVELYYRHSLDNSTWGDWTSFGADNEEPYEWSFDIPAGHGFYEFYSIACDVAGNVEGPPPEADARCATLIPAMIDIDPETLNLRSQGRWITCYIELPGGLDVAKIDVSTVALEGDIFLEGILSAEPWPTEIGDHDGDGVPDLMVKFDRSAVQGLVSVGDNVELTVIGKWGSAPFRGSDTIRVIKPSEGQGQGHGNRPEVPPGQSGGTPGQGGNQGQGQGPPQTPPEQGGQSPGQGQGESGWRAGPGQRGGNLDQGGGNQGRGNAKGKNK